VSARIFASICKVVPRQKLVNAINLVICDTTENISEPSLRVDAVELGGFNQGNPRGACIDWGLTGLFISIPPQVFTN
jgi:hypothetical protein